MHMTSHRRRRLRAPRPPGHPDLRENPHLHEMRNENVTRRAGPLPTRTTLAAELGPRRVRQTKGDGWVHLVPAQASYGSPCDCLASVGRFVLGSPSTTSSYELRTSSTTRSCVTASPARMVSQCRLFMW